MKQIIKQGTPKLFKATCPECGCEFTFIKSDTESELVNDDTTRFPITPPVYQEYITCPCCHEKIRNWEEYNKKSIKYRKKPAFMEAIQFLDNVDRILEIQDFMQADTLRVNYKDKDNPFIQIETPEGTMKVYVGDYIIKGVNGGFYSCKPDFFEKTYEKAE